VDTTTVTKTSGSKAPAVVLLVEDEPLVRMVAADVLYEAGYRVLEAADADEALEILSVRPDVRVLVTDVKMPGEIDGIKLAHIVAKRWPQMSILVTSGHAQPGAGDLPGGALFLEKPYYPSQLTGAVIVLATATSPGEGGIVVEEAVIVTPDPLASNALTPQAGAAAAREKDGEAEA
jgi:CheY-like chemotaxis protein